MAAVYNAVGDTGGTSVPLEPYSRGSAVGEFTVWPRFVMWWETWGEVSVPLGSVKCGVTEYL